MYIIYSFGKFLFVTQIQYIFIYITLNISEQWMTEKAFLNELYIYLYKQTENKKNQIMDSINSLNGFFLVVDLLRTHIVHIDEKISRSVFKI